MQPLYLDDWTEHFFRNLMVFEQCHHIHDSYIIDYIAFLGDLIKTPNDVEILVRYGVLKNLLGNTEDALNFFNTLGKHAKLPTSRYYYSDVCMKLDKFYNDGWNRSIAMLKQKYFAHPRAAAAIIYAVVILILSIVNSATGVISNINGC
ncbi:hypothetical protein Nepgr_001480 [Nepenthes gracilis]|uniref:Uncharacterized protein n=1 Tax=Nepenthes gracilis TaxID=150966 RepID=A0AAD3P4X0_NEPGR|nr:hypothetical protein Nepgr_001480 [Nepenthes gracilis]